MRVPWVMCLFVVFFNQRAETTNCGAIKDPRVDMELSLGKKNAYVTWDTIPNANYTITGCCEECCEGKCNGRPSTCPLYQPLDGCTINSKKSTKRCLVMPWSPFGVTVHVTLRIDVPDCPTKTVETSLKITREEVKPKPVENLTLENLSDGMLAKWSDSYENHRLCYFYKAVEIIDKTEKVMNRNETKTKSAKVRLTNNVLHGYRLIKFCVKSRLCKHEYNGKMSEERCEVIRTLPSAPSRPLTMLCGGDRPVDDTCPVVKDNTERNITLLWKLPEKNYWNGVLSEIKIKINGTLYKTINATRRNYTLTGLRLDREYHIRLSFSSHGGESEMTKPMVFKKENPASPGRTSNGDDVDSTLVIITVAVALVVVIAVILLFIYLNVRAKRKQKLSTMPHLQPPRQGAAHSGTDPNLKTNPADYDFLMDHDDRAGDKISVEKLSCNGSNSSESTTDSVTCPLVAHTPQTTRNSSHDDVTYNPKETGI